MGVKPFRLYHSERQHRLDNYFWKFDVAHASLVHLLIFMIALVYVRWMYNVLANNISENQRHSPISPLACHQVTLLVVLQLTPTHGSARMLRPLFLYILPPWGQVVYMRRANSQSLDGSWELLPVENFAQGFYILDSSAWLKQDLPAHWQQHPLLERYAGKMVYRKKFSIDQGSGDQQTGEPGHGGTGEQGREDTGEQGNGSEIDVLTAQTQPSKLDSSFKTSGRYWLRLNGVFYWSQAFFNGVDLGHHEGYFTPQEHEVTRWVEAENTLIIEVECPDEHNKFGKRLITGVFSHWDSLDPATNPGGIWLPVELIHTGSVHISMLRLDTSKANDAAAEIRFRSTLNASHACDVTLRWTITPQNFAGAVQIIDQRRALSAGEQEIAGLFEIRDPQLWWTRDMGHPHLYSITLDILYDKQLSDSISSSFGIRTFEMHDWIAYLNGARMFIKGNNYPPGDTRIATMTRAKYEQDLRLALECNMNMLRVHAHVEQPDFYEAADAAGILLWQDFPMQWMYSQDVLPHARKQAADMVQLLYNHPSVVLWCMHNEPVYTVDTKDERWITRLRTYFSVFVYSWDRDVMDTQLKQVAETLDQTRPVVRASGEYAVPLLRRGTDSHFYYGWYMVYGRLPAWLQIVKRFPKNIRFVTEFGAQSFPNVESSMRFMDADIKKIDWQHLIDRHHFQSEIMSNWYEWRNARSLEELVEMSQDYQIFLNRFYIDRLRFHKYRPTGGIVPYMFHDSNPAVQWSIIDYWRVPKRSYAAMQQAFSPQYVFTLTAPEPATRGAALELPIYVVNDAHRSIGIELEAQLLSPKGEQLAHIERRLDLPADCMALEIESFRLSPYELGSYRLELSWTAQGSKAQQNVYEIVVQV
jgi:beta-mannosidase